MDFPRLSGGCGSVSRNLKKEYRLMDFAFSIPKAKPYAQSAGLLYLLIAVVGGFSLGYVPSQIVVEGDAAASMQNLLQNQTLFRFGIAGDLAVLIFETLLTVMLYRLFKKVSPSAMLVATFSRLAMAIIMALNVVNYMVPAIIMEQSEYLSSFSEAQLASLNLLFFQIHKYGELAWQVFFSIHLFTLGFVIHKAKAGPKPLGLMMLIGGIAYAGDSIARLLLVNEGPIITLFSVLLILAVIAEFWFAFWLLFRAKKYSTSA